MSGIPKGMTKFAGFNGHKQWKAPGMEDRLTRGELAELVGRDRSRILQLEKAGVLPSPVRVKHGTRRVRLYNKRQVDQIVAYFKEIDARRPFKSGPKGSGAKRSPRNKRNKKLTT